MGYADRDYMKPGRYGGRPSTPGASTPGPFEGAPVCKWLLIINAVVLFLDVLLTKPGEPLFLQSWFSFTIQEAFYQGQIWRLLSFQFLHGGFGHLIFNCIGLFFFGPHIERWMTSRPFFLFYLLCGVAGALFYTLLFFIPGVIEKYSVMSQMVGASAGIFGILAAFYFIAPHAKVYLFLIIPMTMKTLALVIFAMESFFVIFDLHNSGGSAGHLGGALVGLLILKVPNLRNALIKAAYWSPKKEQGGQSSPTRITPRKKILQEKSPLELTQEVDRILDKISEEGIQSLTPKERKTLDQARRK